MAPRGDDQTRERILDATLEHFAARGFEGTAMRELAAAVGVSTAALYYHFENKDALLVALLEPFLDAVSDLLDEERSRTELVEGYVDLLLSHDQLVGLIDLDVAVRHHPAVRDRIDANLQRLRARLAGDPRDHEAVLRASAALGAMRRPVQMLDPDPALARRVLVDAALAILEGR